MGKLLLAAVLTAALLLGGMLLYRHFVTDSIMDKGGMENPYAADTSDEDPASAPRTPEDNT